MYSLDKKRYFYSLQVTYLLTLSSIVHNITFFVPQVLRLFQGGVCFKVGRDKDLYMINNSVIIIIKLTKQSFGFDYHCAPVAQLVEHRAVTREVVSSTPAGPTLRVFK